MNFPFPIFNLLITGLFLCLPFVADAQLLTQTIRGTVEDADSRQTLPGVNVVVITTNPMLGGASDFDGNFRVEEVPVGRHDLRITFLGYEELIVQQVLVTTGKELILNVKLTESVEQLAEVVIAPEDKGSETTNEMATVSSRSFSIEETDRYAASADDPARIAMSFAGVMMNDDITNEIIIRGNSPKGLLWRLEGVEIPNPNHVSEEGESGGAISILSNNVLDRSDFYTGAFPAEYGNASSGVFDLRMRSGNNEKTELAVELTTLGLESSVEGPLSRKYKGSYLVNYRYSTLAVIDAVGYNIQGDLHIGFQDINFKINLPSKRAGTFSLWGIGGKSQSWIDSDKSYDIYKYISRWTAGYNMGVAGLNYNRVLNDKTWVELSSSLSGYNVSGEWGYIWEDNPYEKRTLSIWKNYFFRNSFQLNNKFNSRNTFKAGAIYSKLYFYSSWTEFYDDYFSEGRGNTATVQAYGQWKHRFGANVSLITGLHFVQLRLRNQYSVEPRIGLSWKATPKNTFNFGAGIHSRMETLGTYYAEFVKKNGKVLTQDSLEFMKAFHLVGGWTHKFTPRFKAHAEVYFQYLYDVPIGTKKKKDYSTLNRNEGYPEFHLVNGGKGVNYGLELTLEKQLTRNWYVLATTSLFRSFYTAADSIWKPSKYGVNFIANATGGKDFKVGKTKTNIVGVNTRFTWAGGKRYYPVDESKSQRLSEEVKIRDGGYTERGSNYFRWDLSLSYRRNKPRYNWLVAIDVQNLTNRLNEVHRDYEVESDSWDVTTHVGSIPIFKFRVER